MPGNFTSAFQEVVAAWVALPILAVKFGDRIDPRRQREVEL
jgi:hypothetical protein